VLLAATSAIDIVSVAAAAAAVLALAGCVWLALRLRVLRAAQRAVLGEREATDVVAYVVRLEEDLTLLRDYLDDAAARLDSRLRRAEGRLDGAIAHRALVRYDAYGEMSGRQSLSLALLDASRSGVVLSSILHRDQARIYVKQVRAGESELELSPEEEEALRLALAQDA
jgi:hypothetical protein